jgi:hypothetical protein
MRGAIPPLPQYALMALCLVEHRDNFTFTFNLMEWRQIGFYGRHFGFGYDLSGFVSARNF